MRSLVEIQRFKDSRFAFILIVVLGLMPLALFTVGWSQMQEFSGEDIWTIAGTILISSLTILVMLRIKTKVQLNPDQLIFQTKPFFNRKKAIACTDIIEWKILEHRWKDGLGYQKSLSGKNTYVMSPGKALMIKTKDGRTYKFGINKPAIVKRFIQENWEQNETMYG